MSAARFGRLAEIGVVGLLAAAVGYNWFAWRRIAPTLVPRRRAGARLDGWPRVPSVSCLVAAYDEAAMIGRHLASFKALDYPHKQLVIAAGGRDGTYELARERADDEVIVLRQEDGEGKQRALRRCFEASSGEIVMLTDADCLFRGEDFVALIDPIARGEASASTGYWEPVDEQRSQPFVQFQWLVAEGSEGIRSGVDGVLGFNCAIRREVIDETAAFRAPAPTGTDFVLSRILTQAGHGIRWVPESRVIAEYPDGAGPYLRRWRRWIKNVLLIAPRFGYWRGISPALSGIAVVAATLASLVLTPLVGRIGILTAGLALTVATLNRMRRVAIGAVLTGTTASWRVLVLAPVFALLDQVAVLLATVDTLSRRGRERW